MLPSEIIDHLSNRRQALTKTWLRELWNSPEQATAENTPASELLDHLPDMFEDLLDYLRHDETPQTELHARIHGRSRWEQRFQLQEVLRELLLIRTILINETDHFVGANFKHGADQILREARRKIARFFDDALLFSASQFSEQQQAQIEEDKKVLASQNQTVRAELEAVDAARLRMLRVISHELRNLLNAATLHCDCLLGEEDATWRENLHDRLKRSLRQMTGLVNELLDVAPFLSGRDPLLLSKVDLRTFAEEQRQLFSKLAEAKRVSFDCPPPQGIECVFTDETKLQRIITNLVQNAIKYTPSGGQVILSFLPGDSDRWVLRVSDTGVGIPVEHRAKIFEEFHRVPGSEQQEGAGLGLSIVRQLVTILGGTIKVESEVGRGSTFEATVLRTLYVPEGKAGST
jgi:signal transduction histidine kinase